MNYNKDATVRMKNMIDRDERYIIYKQVMDPSFDLYCLTKSHIGTRYDLKSPAYRVLLKRYFIQPEEMLSSAKSAWLANEDALESFESAAWFIALLVAGGKSKEPTVKRLIDFVTDNIIVRKDNSTDYSSYAKEFLKEAVSYLLDLYLDDFIDLLEEYI